MCKSQLCEKILKMYTHRVSFAILKIELETFDLS